ncbi:MAG TPA: ABC-F family ATP-binding cassette domain-containing protein, partial [Bacteroidia bacterium]|nr:ABC-F family ATP-binding cassette domain-containing protein [Bacteroidia bacterium]
MNYLSAEGLSKSYSETPLFEGLSISLQKGQKMALIAANGSGKSTLLRILAGYETPDNGVVSVRNDITTGYLEQDPRLAPDVAVIDAILESSHPAAQILAEYEKLVARGAGAEEEKMHAVIEKMDALNAWDYEARAREILSRLGITDVEQAAKNLSGGQKKRVALARLLLQEPDLLLMDEPTNHLDLDMIEWLERYLINLNKTLLVVSHDRYFVDGVCNTITEMNNGKLFTYKGNYAYFLQKKEEREFREGREIDKARNLLRTELEWMRRQPQARGTKQKARIDSFYDLDEKANSQKADQKLKITMQMGRLGSKILEFENICKSYGEKTLIKDFSHVFRKGEKAGIVGANGTGKSTLLNMIMGSVKPDQGRIKTGETVSFGYFSQEVAKVDPGKKVIDVVKDITEYVETGDGNWMNVTQFLNHFLF